VALMTRVYGLSDEHQLAMPYRRWQTYLAQIPRLAGFAGFGAGAASAAGPPVKQAATGEMTAAQIDAAVATMALNPLYSANVKIVREGEHGRDATAGGV
jgi:hypothetical protein